MCKNVVRPKENSIDALRLCVAIFDVSTGPRANHLTIRSN